MVEICRNCNGSGLEKCSCCMQISEKDHQNQNCHQCQSKGFVKCCICQGCGKVFLPL